MKPKRRKDKLSREMARKARDRQWRFLERCAEHSPLWFCVWNKKGLPEGPDEWRSGLIDGMEILEWVGEGAPHEDWCIFGEWDADRYAMPVWLTGAGREALQNRELFDMEPVKGGLVEPGWVAFPDERIM